jgi:hypothetical protein
MMITTTITTMAMDTNITNMATNISMVTRRGTSTNINMVDQFVRLKIIITIKLTIVTKCLGALKYIN